MPLLDEEAPSTRTSLKETQGEASNLLEIGRSHAFLSWLTQYWNWFRRNAVSWTLGIVATMVLIYTAGPRYRSWKCQLKGNRTAAELRCERLLQRVNRQVARRGLRRHPHETLHQFARRVRSNSFADNWLKSAAGWYQIYATLRYSGVLDFNYLRKRLPRRRFNEVVCFGRGRWAVQTNHMASSSAKDRSEPSTLPKGR